MAKKKAKEAKAQTDTPATPKSTLAMAKSAVAKAAGKVATAVSKAAGTVEKQVVQPVAEAVGVGKKPKRARFVRKKKEARPEAPTAPLPPRSKSAAGRMMSKGMTLAPKDGAASRSTGRGTNA
jgi:hypothetical protein